MRIGDASLRMIGRLGLNLKRSSVLARGRVGSTAPIAVFAVVPGRGAPLRDEDGAQIASVDFDVRQPLAVPVAWPGAAPARIVAGDDLYALSTRDEAGHHARGFLGACAFDAAARERPALRRIDIVEPIGASIVAQRVRASDFNACRLLGECAHAAFRSSPARPLRKRALVSRTPKIAANCPKRGPLSTPNSTS